MCNNVINCIGADLLRKLRSGKGGAVSAFFDKHNIKHRPLWQELSSVFKIILKPMKGFNEKDIFWFSSDISVFYICWEAKIVQILSPGVVACSCNPATRRRVWGMAWGREPCWSSGHVDPASALRLASTWAPPRSRGGSGCLMRGEPGQGLKPAAKSPRGGQ